MFEALEDFSVLEINGIGGEAIDCWDPRLPVSEVYRRLAEQQRLLFWSGRKAAFPAVGRISPDYLCMDGTIPRKKLPEVLAGMAELSRQHRLAVANVFHAGDGNLHPLILYNVNDPVEAQKAEDAGNERGERGQCELGGFARRDPRVHSNLPRDFHGMTEFIPHFPDGWAGSQQHADCDLRTILRLDPVLPALLT